MAIEFECPSCSAVVRVADEFAGRQGRCPKCRAMLVVPSIEIPEREGSDQGGLSELQTGDTSPMIRAVADATLSGGFNESGGADASGGRNDTGFSAEILNFPAVPEPPISARVQRRRRRQRQRVWMIGVPVVCFLVLFGILASIMTSRLPELSGKLTASTAAGPQLPLREIPWSETGLSADEQQALSVSLTETPAAFSSSLMSCVLTAADSGIQVRLKAAEDQSWYMVDTIGHPALALWVRNHETELRTRRSSELRAAIAAFCAEKLSLSAGTLKTIDAQTYRDSVGLNICVGALGYAMEAEVPGRRSRCAYEDDVGRLYFLLPRGITDFILNGREVAPGVTPFPGEYQVVVRQGESISVQPADESTQTEGSRPPSPVTDESESSRGSGPANENPPATETPMQKPDALITSAEAG